MSTLDLSLSESDLTPSITLKESDNRVVHEYRVNGHLYLVKITPVVGAPYFLVDPDGSGDMAVHRDTPGFETQVPQWTLLSW